MGDLTFRFSTLEDYAGIVKMSLELFGGEDAMDEIYPELMAAPNFHGVVGESNDEIVAFGGAFVVLGGRKLYSTGGRVRSDWRGKKVYGQLKEYLRTRLREEQYPLMAQEEFITHGDNPALPNLLNSKTYRLILKRGFEFYKRTSGTRSFSLKEKSASISAIRAESVGTPGLLSMLSHPETCRRVFPERLLVGMLMFDPVVQNFPFIETADPVVVVSYPGTSTDKGLAIVSTGRKHKSSQYFIRFHFDADTAPLPSVLAEHFVKHVQQHMDVQNGFNENQSFCLESPGRQFLETMNLIECSGFEVIKLFEEPIACGFCRDI